jgi:hypothetical protein
VTTDVIVWLVIQYISYSGLMFYLNFSFCVFGSFILIQIVLLNCHPNQSVVHIREVDCFVSPRLTGLSLEAGRWQN